MSGLEYGELVVEHGKLASRLFEVRAALDALTLASDDVAYLRCLVHNAMVRERHSLEHGTAPDALKRELLAEWDARAERVKGWVGLALPTIRDERAGAGVRS